ncbi:MAG: hypothetical protein AB1779_05330 [Candidatus Thermoplasmatota archaeon]
MMHETLEQKERRLSILEMELRRREEELAKNASELRAYAEELRKKEEELARYAPAQNVEEILSRERWVKVKTDILTKKEKEINETLSQIEEQKKMIEIKAEELRVQGERIKKEVDELRDIDIKKMKLEDMEKVLSEKERQLQTIVNGMKDCPYCDAKVEFVSMAQKIEELKKFGMDTSIPKELLDGAREMLKKGEFALAVQEANKVMVVLANMTEDLKKWLGYLISSAHKTVAEAREGDVIIDTSEAERLLQKAKKYLNENDFIAAEHTAKEAEYIAREVIKRKGEYR